MYTEGQLQIVVHKPCDPFSSTMLEFCQKDEGKPLETLVMKLNSHPRFELGTFWMKIRYVSTETASLRQGIFLLNHKV